MPDNNHRYRQPKLSPRELATVLGALRHWQSNGYDPDITDITTDGGTLDPLTRAEIDKLCERLNTGK